VFLTSLPYGQCHGQRFGVEDFNRLGKGEEGKEGGKGEEGEEGEMSGMQSQTQSANFRHRDLSMWSHGAYRGA